ncbi:MAG TPA: extracellular solute-binding protein [Phycisphaerae bacterium]|nr:extracellular solute-binding protein [Phycisphaerae bacterium]
MLPCVVLLGSCGVVRAGDDRPVVYCSVDEGLARDLLDRFEAKTGIKVDAVFDSEAGKTTGLVTRIRLEERSPRADVLFSGELFHTMLLAREGLLEAYEPPSAADIPKAYKDAEHRWTAIGLRARVLAYDGQKVPAEELPIRWDQLADPEFAPRVAFANPLFGTTNGHVAAMFALWGESKGRAFLTRLRDNGAKMVDGNSSAVRAIIAGKVEMCMTDSDDVLLGRRRAPQLEPRYLDMGDGGTLLIPSSVAIIKGCRHLELARRLADFLVSAEVERMLALSDARNIPVRADLRRELNMELPPTTGLSYERIADAMETAASAVREILIR